MEKMNNLDELLEALRKKKQQESRGVKIITNIITAFLISLPIIGILTTIWILTEIINNIIGWIS